MAQTQTSQSKSHRERKSGHGADEWRKAKAARNAARGHQVWVESTLDGRSFTYEELVAFTDEQIERMVVAHWVRV